MPLSRRALLKTLSTAGAAAFVPAGWATSGAISSDGTLSGGAVPIGTAPGGWGAREATDTAHTLTPVPIESVVIDDAFWAPKREVWRAVTLWDCFRKFEEQQGGALNNFDRVRDGLKGGHAGFPWQDGLVYEMIRAASDFLRSGPDPELDAKLDGYVARIVTAAAKDPGGYVNTYTQLEEPDHRWGLNGGLEVWQHEFYNLGALVDAGVHHYRATGKTPLLEAGVRIANTMDALVSDAVGKNLVPAHELPEEAVLGLHELFVGEPGLAARLTVPVDPKRYLALAEFWIENRGRHVVRPAWEADRARAEAAVRAMDYAKGRPSWGAYAQDETPILEQNEVVGHAVRSTLLCSAVAATGRVNGRGAYRETAVRLWENMTTRRMHVTGGVGAFANEEAFGPDYALPNDAYLETCAAVGAGFFHANMARTFGHARYADELERVLYNGVLCGISLAGDAYTYQNPLVADESRARWAWHDCPCCPPMFLKIMGAMPGYVYATDANSAYVNLFVGSRAEMKVDGNDLVLRQTTAYPWNGAVRIEVEPAREATFGMMLRIPAWCRGAIVRVNGRRVPMETRVRGYLRIERPWRKGDVIEIELPMPVETVRANPKVLANVGRTALVRGPLVYCFESYGNELRPDAISLSADAGFETVAWPDRLGGIVAIRGLVRTEPTETWEDSLYAPTVRPASRRSTPHPTESHPAESHRIVAVPFYANGNRGPAPMAVWLRRDA